MSRNSKSKGSTRLENDKATWAVATLESIEGWRDRAETAVPSVEFFCQPAAALLQHAGAEVEDLRTAIFASGIRQNLELKDMADAVLRLAQELVSANPRSNVAADTLINLHRRAASNIESQAALSKWFPLRPTEKILAVLNSRRIEVPFDTYMQLLCAAPDISGASPDEGKMMPIKLTPQMSHVLVSGRTKNPRFDYRSLLDAAPALLAPEVQRQPATYTPVYQVRGGNAGGWTDVSKSDFDGMAEADRRTVFLEVEP